MSSSSTWDNDDIVNRMMFKEITSTKPLSKEQEIALFTEYKITTPARKKAIRAIIVNANLRFALKSCLLYKNVPNVNLADLMTEAKIGLLHAFDTYNQDGGTKFISWAVWQIRHRFSKYFDGIDLIRIPTHQKTKLNKARKEMDIDSFNGDTLFFHTITQVPVSLDMQCSDDDPDCKLHEILVDENAENPESEMYKQSMRHDLSSIIDSSLTPDEATIIKTIYGFNNNGSGLSDAAYMVNRSHERVRQLRDKALGKLSKLDSIKDCVDIVNSTKSTNLR